MNDNSQKIFFVQSIGNGEYETEGLWCEKVDDLFIIDNIPFIAKNVSLGDNVKAEYDNDEKVYYFDGFIAESGNTTLRLLFIDASLIEPVRKQLNDYKCESEVLLQRKIVAVNVPKDVVYRPVKEFLDKGEEDGLWTYEESCLAHKY